MFNAVSLPIKKLGLNFCLNKPNKLWYISDPKTKKEDADKTQGYSVHLNSGDFMGMHAKFSKDYSILSFVASTNKFVSHSSNYQLKCMKWPFNAEQTSKTVIDYVHAYPTDQDDFAGLFGYQMTFPQCGFIGHSNRYYLIESEFKG